LMEVPIKTVELVVKVNLLGVLFGTKVAMDIMKYQSGITGEIFNTVGSGVKGGGTPGNYFRFLLVVLLHLMDLYFIRLPFCIL